MKDMLGILRPKKDKKGHWDTVYHKKAPDEVTWYQVRPERSLEFIEAAGARPESRIIDIGGGASTLVDHLLQQGLRHLAILDLSGNALEAAIRRLGPDAADVRWIEADITRYELAGTFDVWHDRAVFHFLTEPEEREAYLKNLEGTLRFGGHVVISTFGPEGPKKCSGLPVVRYSPETLRAELGEGYTLLESRTEIHVAPTGHEQQFIYCLFRKDF